MAEARPAPSPRAMLASGLCIGCGSCASREPAAGMGWNRYGQLRPRGPRAWEARGDDLFARTCPFSPEAAKEDLIGLELYPDATEADPQAGRFEAAFVGHVAEGGFRAAASSGGLATWAAAELLRRGMVDGVAHVVPTPPESGRLFRYAVSRDEEALRQGAKSRYYPIDMAEVLAEIRAVPGRYAVVGIPCFIKAVNLARRAEPLLAGRIVATIGLFCGHMKSAALPRSFARQIGVPDGEMRGIDFRRKDPSRPANWYTAEIALKDGSRRWQDWWHLVEGDWGSGFLMHPACNFCDDVTAETADIALGDAWLEPYSSDGNGTNVVVVRSRAMLALVEAGIAEGRLALKPVDRDFVVATQAAGLRQRREGLAWRLARAKLPVMPDKRVAPSRRLRLRRKLIYGARQAIARWSHRVLWLAERTGWPGLYLAWGRAVLKVYHGLAYSRGRIGRLVDRYIDPAGEG